MLTHEAAHLIVMRLLGIKASRFRVGTFGVGIEAKYGLASYLKQAAVSLSGSLFNILCAAVFVSYKEVSAACLAYGLFNLLPLSMLDGGELIGITLAACGVCEKTVAAIHRTVDAVLTAAVWAIAVYLALNGVGEGLLISALYMVFSRVCTARS